MESGSDSEQKDLIPVISKCREIVLEVAGRPSEDAGGGRLKRHHFVSKNAAEERGDKARAIGRRIARGDL